MNSNNDESIKKAKPLSSGGWKKNAGPGKNAEKTAIIVKKYNHR
jgi:hypothetical protein